MSNHFCTSCGAALAKDQLFCTSCGSKTNETTEPAVSAAAPDAAVSTPDVAPTIVPAAMSAEKTPAPVPQQVVYSAAPPPVAVPAPLGDVPASNSKYAPITTKGYLGIIFLMCIPILGQLLTLIWAFGGCRKVNKRNFARAIVMFSLVAVILCVILYFVFMALFADALKSLQLNSSDPFSLLQELNNLPSN